MKSSFNQNYKGMRCRVCLVRENTGDEIIRINKPSDVYDLVKDELSNSDREMFLSIMLTVRNDLDHLIVSNKGYKSLRDHYKFAD